MSIPTSGTYKLYFSPLNIKTGGNFVSSTQKWATIGTSSSSGTFSVKFENGNIMLVGSGNGYSTIYPAKFWGSPDENSFIMQDIYGNYYYFSTTLPNDYLLLFGNGGVIDDSTSWRHGSNTLTPGGTSSFNPGPIVCFLRDSMIATPTGDVPVQELRVGDEVMCLGRDRIKSKKITWIGKATHVVDRFLPDDFAGYPVRVCAGALASRVPFKDLLITPDHCLYIDGKLIPARMLVNGKSIIYDKEISSFDYYHIKTETHSIICADGAWTESYLDTGNNERFLISADIQLSEEPANETWHSHAAAPLCVDHTIVGPLFQSLKLRAENLGFTFVPPENELFHDTEIHLETTDGDTIWPIFNRGKIATFNLPAGLKGFYIVSNYARPCDSIGPYMDDRRWLGVLIGRMVLETASSCLTLCHHLEENEIAGWNARENAPMRWTKGRAYVQLIPAVVDKPCRLIMNIIAGGPYLKSQRKQGAQYEREELAYNDAAEA